MDSILDNVIAAAKANDIKLIVALRVFWCNSLRKDGVEGVYS